MSFRLGKLQTTNFRNLQSDVISFGPTINCILGGNGNGKTNILEAVYLLANKKSFRKNTGLPQYLSIDGDRPEVLISSVISDGRKEHTYSARLRMGSSEWFMDARPFRFRQEGAPLKTIFINPFDSHTFHTLPSFRRDWFNHTISIIDPVYKKQLNYYNKALKFKNALLSKKRATIPRRNLEVQLDAIDGELAKWGGLLVKRRLMFTLQIEKYCKGIFHELFSEEHTLNTVLDPSIPIRGPVSVTREEVVTGEVTEEQEKLIRESLRKNRLQDQMMGYSTKGPHRDDYALLFDGLNSFEFCSLGQQKMIYLSLSFAYIQLFRYIYRAFPMVLIDDISGELDESRWNRLVRYLKKGQFQVLITTANEKFKEALEEIDDITQINVSQGAIVQVQ